MKLMLPRILFISLFLFLSIASSANNGIQTSVVDTPINLLIYGDESYMVLFNPAEYEGPVPLPDDIPGGSGSAYYRMRYESLSDGHWQVSYKDRKSATYLRGTIWSGKPIGTWTYYFSNGHVMKEVVYSDGIWKGKERQFYPNGQLKFERVIDRTQDICGFHKRFDEDGNLLEEGFYVRDVLLKEVYYTAGKKSGERTFNQPYHIWRNRIQAAGGDESTATYQVHLKRYYGEVPDYDRTVMKLLQDRGIGTIEEVKNEDGSVSFVAGDFTDYKEARRWIFVLETYGMPRSYIMGYLNGKLVESRCY